MRAASDSRLNSTLNPPTSAANDCRRNSSANKQRFHTRLHRQTCESPGSLYRVCIHRGSGGADDRARFARHVIPESDSAARCRRVIFACYLFSFSGKLVRLRLEKLFYFRRDRDPIRSFQSNSRRGVYI